MCIFTGEREREREIHYVHSASLAYEDGIVFMSEMCWASSTLLLTYGKQRLFQWEVLMWGTVHGVPAGL